MTATTGTPPATPREKREARLAQELRANLQKRKAQARSRRTGEADERPDGLNTTTNAAGESKA